MDDLPLTCNNINIHSWISTIQNILILQHHCMFYVLPATVATSSCHTLLYSFSSLPRSRNPSWTEVPSTCLGGWTSGGGRRCRCPGGRRILKGNKFDSVCLGINDIILKQLVCYQQGFYAISWGNIIFEVHLVSLEQKWKKNLFTHWLTAVCPWISSLGLLSLPSVCCSEPSSGCARCCGDRLLPWRICYAIKWSTISTRALA